MQCQYCGHDNPDTALTCGACGCSPSLKTADGAMPPPMAGSPLPPPMSAGAMPPPMSSARLPPLPQAQVPNYLVWSILATLCCCLPAGIVAIVYSAQVNSKQAAGDYTGAVAASDNAKMWCWISFGLGIVIGILSFASGAMEGAGNRY